MMNGITPAANFFPSDMVLQDGTSYKQRIDANFSVLSREGTNFAPATWPSPYGSAMQLLLGPGHFYNGTAVVEVGGWLTGDFTNGSATVANVSNTGGLSIGQMIMAYRFNAVTVTGNTATGNATVSSLSSVVGLYVGMNFYGPGIAPGSRISSVGASSVVLDRNAQATATGVTLLSSGMSPVAPLGTTIIAIGSTTLTMSQNAVATVTGAGVEVCQPVGGIIKGDTASGSNIITNMPSTIGLFNGQTATGTGVPAATTIAAVLSSTSVQLSANATANGTAVPLTFGIPAPASNSRIDLISVSVTTGLLTYTMGTPAATPVAPALPTGYLPVALLTIPSGTTALTATNMSDVRTLSAMGLAGGAYSAPVSVVARATAIVANLAL